MAWLYVRFLGERNSRVLCFTNSVLIEVMYDFFRFVKYRISSWVAGWEAVWESV